MAKPRHVAADVALSVSIERLAEARGLTLTKRGSQLVGSCPFNEGKAKVSIDGKANTWSCSACAITDGGPIEWVMKAEGISRKHAIELLRTGKVTLSRKQKGPVKGAVPRNTTVRSMDVAFTAADTDAAILAGVVEFYRRALCANAEAKAFLDARGLPHPELASHFQLGFANKTLGLRIPKTNRVAGRQLRDRLQGLGVLRTDTGHEHLSGCLVVPVFDISGAVVNLYGRRIERTQRGSAEHLWANPKKCGLFNPAAFTSSSEIIVTASITDALTCWCHGSTSVTAVHGLDGPVTNLFEALTQHKTRRVTLAFRRTKDGQNAIQRLAPMIAALGIEVLRLVLPADQDVNDFVRSAADPGFALTQLARSAEWVAGAFRGPVPKSSPTAPAAALAAPDVPTPAPVAGSPPGPSQGELAFVHGDRRWRVRGLDDNRARGTLKVNILVTRDGVGFHVDSFDLYSSRHRVAFVRLAAAEVGLDEDVIKKDLGTVLLALEQAQEELLLRIQAPVTKTHEMTADERDAALELLRDRRLLDRVVGAFEKLGVVGEQANLTIAHLAGVSRKLEHPLAVIVQSSSAAGKSSLLDAVVSLVPEEDRQSFSAMTGQSLFYMSGSGLKNKLLYIAEQAGAERASYSLKLLQTQGSLTIASTAKEATTGRLVSQEYRVEGPVAIMMTTTSIDVDEELLNRCLVLTVDESADQTRRIQEAQRMRTTLDGLAAREAQVSLLDLHHNIQRLLRPLRVVIPFAADIAFPDHRVRGRRDQRKLLGLVEASALLHQHQRITKTIEVGTKVVEYVEASKDDLVLADRLLREVHVLGLGDLPPQTEKLLRLIEDLAGKNVDALRFSRRQLREHVGWGDTQLWTHLRRLVDLELLAVHPSGQGRGIVYELHLRPARIRGNSGDIRPDSIDDSEGIRGQRHRSNPTNQAADATSGRDQAEHARPGGKHRNRVTRANGAA